MLLEWLSCYWATYSQLSISIALSRASLGIAMGDAKVRSPVYLTILTFTCFDLIQFWILYYGKTVQCLAFSLHVVSLRLPLLQCLVSLHRVFTDPDNGLSCQPRRLSNLRCTGSHGKHVLNSVELLPVNAGAPSFLPP
ncbi:hypothetical protein DK47_3174 [Brucella abortus 2308]|nr:hypothetical protein DK47_3174 [Brucella abortus 2308]